MRAPSPGAAAASLAATLSLLPSPVPGRAAPPDPFKEEDASTVVEPQRRVDGFVFRCLSQGRP